MSNYQNPYARFGSSAAGVDAQALDQGLRSYMLKIYNYMGLGVAITGVFALLVYSLATTTVGAPDAVVTVRSSGLALTSFGYAVFASPLKWVLMLAPLAFIMVLSFGINRLSPAMTQLLFWAFCAIMGVSMSSIFLIYVKTSITQVFFITAIAFGGLSLIGYTTKKSLSGMGSFLMMGLIGIVVASLVNLFVGSSALQFAISVIGVLVFSGLIAYDTQRLKDEYIYGYAGTDAGTQSKAAIMGALSLYLNFINLFQMLLSLLGQREN
ncbi:MAG: Bax inhibitor-1/YccA family protein [Hyphomicrobiaceae bacterium]|nr:Bax inhibitor-1/YccA family protein [Hyphomicrobiaceae bacterium]